MYVYLDPHENKLNVAGRIARQVFEIFGAEFNKFWHLYITENSREILQKKPDILPTKKQTKDATNVLIMNLVSFAKA